jgi:hypothetical protein
MLRGRRRRMDALEASVQRLAGQVAVSEALFGTIAALALRTLSDDVRDTILQQLRVSITTSVKGLTNPSDAGTLTLQLEENVARLLDQIEHMVRFSPNAEASPKSSRR